MSEYLYVMTQTRALEKQYDITSKDSLSFPFSLVSANYVPNNMLFVQSRLYGVVVWTKFTHLCQWYNGVIVRAAILKKYESKLHRTASIYWDVDVILQVFFKHHYNNMNSPHKRPVTRKIFPFDDVIMISRIEYLLRWVPQNHLDDKSICVHVMVWCHQVMLI